VRFVVGRVCGRDFRVKIDERSAYFSMSGDFLKIELARVFETIKASTHAG
jgi:hypothetical protein